MKIVLQKACRVESEAVMTTNIAHGSPQFPATTGKIVPSTREAMDEAIGELQAHKEGWLQVSVGERIVILDRLLKDFSALVPRWVAACCQGKGIAEDSPWASDEWAAGTWPVLKNLQQLRHSLLAIVKNGYPHIPGPITTRANGQVVAQVFPQNNYDRLFLSGVTAEVWMEPGVSAADLPKTQGLIYQGTPHEGKVNLVLGAGNVASIAPTDILYKLFVQDQVVFCKMNPVNAHMGPLIEESFRALIEAGYLRVAYGGIEEGAYLCNHSGIDEIHITGSDKTFDAIVFGSGPEGTAHKASHQPLLEKHVTGELGNVSPIIVVPGPWSTNDLAYQAEHIVSSLTNNAGFNCNASRLIIQHADWPERQQLIQQISSLLAHTALRPAYYPGARERQQAFVAAHPEAEQFGTPVGDLLPWTLIPGIAASRTDDICFTTEAFCGLFAETILPAENTVQYIERAVALANENIWGTLNVTLLVHPQSLKDPAVATAIEQAVGDLHYGTVGVNYWAGTGFLLMTTTWGAFPGHTIYDIQSGNDVVHNTLMFSKAQKSVLRGPFRSIPKPPWFVTRAKAGRQVFTQLVDFEAKPSPWKVPKIAWSAIAGEN